MDGLDGHEKDPGLFDGYTRVFVLKRPGCILPEHPGVFYTQLHTYSFYRRKLH